MYEHRDVAPLPRAEFLRRWFSHMFVASAILGGSLFGGMAGYRYFEQLSWRDAFLNAAMLLGGMGPVTPPITRHGKVFAGFYALYSGLVFLLVTGIILAPAAHRLLHLFHWEQAELPHDH